MLIVNTEIQQMGEKSFMGWSHEFKALVVQGASVEEVKRELLISLRAKVAYDTKLPISNIDAQELTLEILDKLFEEVSKTTFKTKLVA